MPSRLWTIGHSTQSLEQFIGLLTAHRIGAVADVRRYPGSRRWPHFSREGLARSLAARGLVYDWFPELGGRRRPLQNSANTGWRNAAFRGYADYMATEEFAGGLERLVTLAGGLRTAIMCAEAVWWRCHRGLIADALRFSGYEVYHIMGPESAVLHPYTSAARRDGGVLSYAPAETPNLFSEDMHHVPQH